MHHLEPQTWDLPTKAVVSVKNLQLPCGVIAPNVWNIPKEQPASVTVTLHLSQSFDSVAAKDALDQNTVHYGELSKRVRACCSAPENVLDVFANVEDVINMMSRRYDGTSRISTAVIEVNLNKACMFGEKVCLVKTVSYDVQGRTTCSQLRFTLDRMKIMTLIGVNDYERKARQPVIASLELSTSIDGLTPSQIAVLFDIEDGIVNACPCSTTL